MNRKTIRFIFGRAPRYNNTLYNIFYYMQICGVKTRTELSDSLHRIPSEQRPEKTCRKKTSVRKKTRQEICVGSTSLVSDVNKHLRPISLTPILSKVGEEFVVDGYIKPAVLAKIDQNQYGTVPNSSTVHALISMLHNWYKNTDGNGSTVRVVLFDFRKAFDLIDHAILMAKLTDYELPLDCRFSGSNE